MSDLVKYIALEEPTFKLRLAVVFPEVLQHDAIEIKKGKVLSAGFYSKELGAHGQSVSLGLSAQRGDTELVEAVL